MLLQFYHIKNIKVDTGIVGLIYTILNGKQCPSFKYLMYITEWFNIHITILCDNVLVFCIDISREDKGGKRMNIKLSQ